MTLTRRGRALSALAVLLGVVAAAAAVGFVYLRSLGLTGASDPQGRVGLVVPEGASVTAIGELLEQRGVVRSALGFRLAALLEGGGDAIQAGRYRLRAGLSARDALAALARGPEVEVTSVTFPEGSWVTDFARIVGRATDLSGDRFLELARSGEVRSRLQPPGTDSLEGMLWPSTYEVGEDDSARSLLERLVTEGEERVAEVDLGRARAEGLSAYEAVIVASMVEAEAKVPGDRPKIAAVIFNRLDRGMMLGIDATVAYAVGERGGALTPSDLDVDSPFNTRRYAGLPPTPIGAPGEASLRATADPASGSWLYFVLADCNGRHAFSTSYADFLADKAAYGSLEC